MVKFLGLLDLFGTFLLLSILYKVDIPSGLIITIAACLIIKGIIFITDLTSLVDIALGVLLILSLSLTLPAFIILPFALFSGVKAIMSLFAS